MLGVFGQRGVSANRPYLAHFQNLSTIYCTKPKLKGGPFYENLPTCVFGAPQFGPFHTNGGVCQSAINEPILNLSTVSGTKSKFKEGVFFGLYGAYRFS